MMEVESVVLQGRFARLEPPDSSHAQDLLVAGQSPDIWPYMPFGPFPTAEAWRDWIATQQQRTAKGEIVSFAITRLSDSRAVGMTSYLNISRANRGLEIGATWLAPAAQRTAINSECKYLLLRHAFEKLGCIRVQLKTDLRNVVSQRAIERLGAVREGILRKHMIVRDGYARDTVMYSVIDSEWPGVKAKLEKGLYSEEMKDERG